MRIEAWRVSDRIPAREGALLDRRWPTKAKNLSFVESCCQPFFQKHLYGVANILPDCLAKVTAYLIRS